jgi:hypothetical protein
MDNQELIAKYKKQLENKYLDDETKTDLRKKIKSLQEKTQGVESKSPEKKSDVDETDDKAKSDRIAELKELLEAPLPPVAKKAFREELEMLQGEKKSERKVTPKPKPKPKPKPQPKAEPKKEVKPIPSKVVRKAVKDKPERKKVVSKADESIDDKIASLEKQLKEANKRRNDWVGEAKTERGYEQRANTSNSYTKKIDQIEEELIKLKGQTKGSLKKEPISRGRKPIQKVVKAKEEPQKRARKPKVQAPPAPKKERVKKTYVPKAKPSNEEPDCDTLLLQFRARRKKAKESQAKRKTTPVFRKIASDVVDAVEKAIKNVPAKTIKESPKETIKKFGMLKKSAEQFLSAFRTILGKEYARSEADKELNELKSLIDKLVKKYK